MIKKILLASLAILSISSIAFAQNYNNSNSRYPNFCNTVNGIMVRGEQGQRVRELQFLIKQQYSFGQGITGFYGLLTDRNVRAMQRSFGINPSGAIGPITLSRLQSIWCIGSSTPVITPGNINIPTVSISPISSNGNNVTIGWNSSNAVSCSINGENVGISGTKQYTIYNETNYRLVCLNANNVAREQTALVKPNTNTSNNIIPTINISVNPTSFTIGQNANLFWNSNNANSCTLNGNSVGLNSNQTIYISGNNQNYVLSCSGSGGTVTQTLSVNGLNSSNVNNNSNIINTFTGALDSSNNNNVVLNWTGSGTANTCSLFRVTSLGPTDNVVNGPTSLIASNLSTNQNNYVTPFLSTSGNYSRPTAAYKLVCGNDIKFVNVQSNANNLSNNYNLSLNTNITAGNNFTRGSLITIQSTLRNNGNTNISFPSGSSSCPSDISVTINGNTFNSFISNGLGLCTADFRTENLAPGQSIIRTFTGNINNNEFIGNKSVVAKFSARINNDNNLTEIVNNANFNVPTENISLGAVALSNNNVSEGQSLNITWGNNFGSSQNSSNNRVYLSLIDPANNTSVGIIRDNLAISGSFNWIIPSQAMIPVTGGNYIIEGRNIIRNKNYIIKATLYTPSTQQCIEGCSPTSGVQIGSQNSTQFVILNSSSQAISIDYWSQFNLKNSYINLPVKQYENYLIGENNSNWTKLLTYNIDTRINNLNAFIQNRKQYVESLNSPWHFSEEINNSNSLDSNRVYFNVFTLTNTPSRNYEVTMEKVYVKNNQIYSVIYAEKIPFSNSIDENNKIYLTQTKFRTNEYKNALLNKQFSF